MTRAEKKRFFFPAWNRAAESHGWVLRGGRLAGKRLEVFGPGHRSEINVEYQKVWNAAEQFSATAHRAVQPSDLRHGCYVAALRRDKKTDDLFHKEVTRVVNLFKVLADPDDLDAVLDYFHPVNQERKELVWWLENKATAGWPADLAEDIYGTRDWPSLETWQLRALRGTIRDRKNGVAEHSVSTSENEPF